MQSARIASRDAIETQCTKNAVKMAKDIEVPLRTSFRRGTLAIFVLLAAVCVLASPAECEPSCLTFREARVDVYTCETRGIRPVLVFVSAGGRGRANAGWLAHEFSRMGIAFAVFDYTVTPGRAPIGSVDDVAAAIAWIHTNAARFHGDPERLFVIGYSAGAHLAALVSTDEQYLQLQSCDLGILRGTILLDNDVFNPSEQDSPGSLLDPWGASTADAEKAWNDIAPSAHVAPGKGIPPMLIISTGEFSGRKADDIGVFMNTLANAGVGATLVVAAECTHESILYELADPRSTVLLQIASFILSQSGAKQQ